MRFIGEKFENTQNEMRQECLDNGITDEQVDLFKSILIPGLPDFEWTDEYNLYLSDPDNEAVRNAVLARLGLMYQRMLNSPDFQLQ